MKDFLPPERYAETPIVLTDNPNTGYKWGEDGPNLAKGNPGYRGMQTLRENHEPLVVPAGVEARSVLGGASLYAREDDPTTYTLPGGLPDEAIVLREIAARAIDLGAANIDRATSGEVRLVVVDGLETYMRQRAGFTRILKNIIEPTGIVEPTVAELHAYGKQANGTYCYVKADEGAKEYQDLARELQTGESFEQLAEIARTRVGGAVSFNQAMESVLSEFIAISANSNMGPAKDRQVPLNFEHNAHAGAAAADLFPVDSKSGLVLSIVPYCWVGPEAAMDYMENDANFDAFKQKWAEDSLLATHMKMVGYDSPENFKWSDWERFRMANRVRYHALVGVGCTFYSADPSEDGGEDWHLEPDGAELFDWDGRLVVVSQYVPHGTRFGTGNPGHTLQMRGPKAVAVYGGRSGHEQARKQFGLEF
jgi:hypothetical protein